MEINKVNLKEKFSKFDEHWAPKIVGELNEQHVKIAKLKGEFVWHYHENEDELFFVTKGVLKIELEDKTIEINEGEFVIIPKGVKHKPYSENSIEVQHWEKE